MKKMHLRREPNLEVKFKAFDYQREAFEAIKDLPYAAIFHEQGLGKTKIAIDLVMYWLDKTDIDTVLILTKKQLVHNWEIEFSNHTYMKPSVISDDKKSNFYVFTGPARVIIAHFETINSEFDRYQLFLKTRNIAIIIDESAKIKNPATKLTQNLFELAPLFFRRVIMTGTPVANRPYDIWSQIYFLDLGKSLGADYESFKKISDLNNKLSGNAELQQEFQNNIAQIYRKIESFCVRETKNSGIISLPQKVYENVLVDFYPEQLALYKKIREELKLEMHKDGEIIVDDSSAVVKRLLRLVQVTSNPKLLDDIYSGSSPKEDKLDELIKSILSRNEKCIVWSSFIDNVNYLQSKYKEFGAVKIHGGMAIAERNKSVDKFKTDSYKILFATPASAKEGLTLTMANHVIFYDRGFSLDDYLQAQDRIHRISQTKTCYIYNLIVNNSVDEWIDVLLKAKQTAAFLVQGDINEDEYSSSIDYSFGDIIKEILNSKVEV